MPDLDFDKLCYTVVIKKVPKYGHVYASFIYDKGIVNKRIEEEDDEKGGQIIIPVPYLFEGDIIVKLWRPDIPIPSSPHVQWKDQSEPNNIVFSLHTDDFKDRRLVINDHAFANLKMVETIFGGNIEWDRKPYREKGLIGRMYDRCKEMLAPEKMK